MVVCGFLTARGLQVKYLHLLNSFDLWVTVVFTGKRSPPCILCRDSSLELRLLVVVKSKLHAIIGLLPTLLL